MTGPAQGPAQVESVVMPEGDDVPIVTTGAPSLAGPIDPLLCPPRPPSNAKALLIGMVGAGLMICVVGLIVNLTRDPSAANAAPPPASNYFLEQQKSARAAIQMARELQEMQKERLRLMQQEMRAAGQGMPPKPENPDPSTID